MGARDTFADPAEFVADILRRHLAVPPVMRCSDWADKFRRIAKGPEKGLWRTDRTPYLREPMNCMDPENPVQKVVMQFATQLGKSEVIYNSIFKRIHLSPMDMMMVQPTLQDAKDHSSQRFTQTAKLMPQVISRIAETRSRDETNTLFTKEIADGSATLFFSGANSARSLASKPLGFAACDEVDGYPLDVDGEGDPIGLVTERMSNFPNRKLLMCSTPTTKDFSTIEAEYLASDRRRYWVPCPHCLALQVLTWGADKEYGIKYLKTAAGEPRPETAVYVCEHCGAAIENHHKTGMLADGRWIADQPGAQNGTVAGFHLSKLYSPVGWKSWEMLVRDWVSARDAAKNGDVSKLKRFVNTSLAETWEEQGDRANEHELRKRAADFPLRTVRGDMFVMTIGADVQGDRLEAYRWAWGRGMERQLVDREVIYGDPAQPEVWQRLTEYRRTPVLNVHGREVPLLATMIDSGGHHTQAVYSYCRAFQGERVHATKGQSQAGKAILGRPSAQDVNYRGEKAKRGVKLWPIGADTAKAEIYGRLRLGVPGPGYIHLTRELPAEVFEQLTAERLVTRYVKGHAKLEWVKPAGKRNEALDCAVLALAAAHWAGVDRWKEGDWKKYERRVQPLPVAAEPAPPTEPAPMPAEERAEQPEPKLPQPPAEAPAPADRPVKKRGRIRGGFGVGNSWR
jgi:phage terminase large subunit GpA-like protein